MRVLISHETSGVTREAFRKLGHKAYSCDILPTETRDNRYHFQSSIERVLSIHDDWDLIIAHPVCTKLCVSGNHKYAKGKPYYTERLTAACGIQSLWNKCKKCAPRVCFENPVGVINTLTDLPKPQIIQPYQFGHDASKKTCLFLHNLPPLVPTTRIQGRIVDGKERFANQTDSGQNRLGPSPDRWKIRSRTYEGIADAFATQWGNL